CSSDLMSCGSCLHGCERDTGYHTTITQTNAMRTDVRLTNISENIMLPSSRSRGSGGNAMAGNARHAGRSVTSRALAVLAAFDGRHRCLSLSQISRRAELSLTTTHRLLRELQCWGALKRREDRKSTR